MHLMQRSCSVVTDDIKEPSSLSGAPNSHLKRNVTPTYDNKGELLLSTPTPAFNVISLHLELSTVMTCIRFISLHRIQAMSLVAGGTDQN